MISTPRVEEFYSEGRTQPNASQVRPPKFAAMGSSEFKGILSFPQKSIEI